MSQQTPTINRQFGSRTKNSSNHRSPAFDDDDEAVKLSTFVCLTDVLHGCVINYVIKSQREESENYEILLNTSRDVSLAAAGRRINNSHRTIARCRKTIAQKHHQIEQLQSFSVGDRTVEFTSGLHF